MPRRPTMPQMIEALAIELIEAVETDPATLAEEHNLVLLQAGLDFAWGRADRPWGNALAEAMADRLPDVFADALEECGEDAERLPLYAATARRLIEIEESVAGSAVDRAHLR